MQYHFMEGHSDKMMDLYPKLIESIIEFRVYYRKLIAERNGETYRINSEHETCPLAHSYKIIKVADYQYRCEKELDEETEQLDQESNNIRSIDPEQANEQANEQEYRKSVEIEEMKVKSSIKKEEIKVLEPAKKSNNNLREYSVEDKHTNNEVYDSVNIKIELPIRHNEQAEAHVNDIIPTEEEEKRTNIGTTEDNKITARWIKSENEVSQPALQIEGEESAANGGMCSCSK
jgi:hypothetical protein